MLPSALVTAVQDAISRAQEHLLSLQAPDGHWVGELEADRALTAEYLLLCHFIDRADRTVEQGAVRYFRRRQNADGGWSLFEGGPSDLSATIKIYFAMVFMWGLKAWAVDSPSKDLYVGIGAFNLVRRAAYEGIGGHEALRLEVADDLMLGKRIKQAGYRQEALFAPSHLRLRWLEGVRGVVLGLEKNGEESYQVTLGGSSAEDADIGKIIGPAFSSEDIVDAVESLVGVYLEKRHPGERFLDTYRRVGQGPFKERLYGAD